MPETCRARAAPVTLVLSYLWQAACLIDRLIVWLMSLAIRLYQITLSPFIGRSCRFQPTCSNYMLGAIHKYGSVRGCVRGIWRICRCNPLCKGGYDPP